MTFLETPRFPTDISYGSSGGPMFSTDVVVVASGAESRNQNWSAARLEFEIRQLKGIAQIQAFIAFFRAVKGRTHAFRFKDHSDYRTTDDSGAGFLAEVSGASPASVWQMYKRYTAGSLTDVRMITKPVTGTAVITGGGTYSVDYTTGRITHTAGAPPTGFTCQFDTPVRFNADSFKLTYVDKDVASIENLGLIEVLDE